MEQDEMNVRAALEVLCDDLGFDADLAARYAAEDTVGGAGAGWSNMAISREEGQVLYALVRIMRPVLALEIGVWDGCSTTHLISAITENRYGTLTSIDLPGQMLIADRLSAPLKRRWIGVEADALTCELPPADFVFEDGAHTYEFTRAMLTRLVELKPRIILGHDVLYPGWGQNTLRAYREILPGCKVIEVGQNPRGLAYWWSGVNDET